MNPVAMPRTGGFLTPSLAVTEQLILSSAPLCLDAAVTACCMG